MIKIEKVMKVIHKLEKLEASWTCPIEEIDPKKGIITKRLTHLRSIPPDTGKLLKSLVLLTNSKVILELGCSGGYSSLWMSLGTIETKGHIYTTEIIPDKIRLAKRNFKEAGVEKMITLKEGDIFNTLDKLNLKNIDLVFIDADKEKYLNYYKRIFPLVKKGGLIVADNMVSHASYLKEFVKSLEKDKRINFEIISLDSGLLIARKN